MSWRKRLREKLVKALLSEGVIVTMSVARAMDEFIDTDVSRELKREREDCYHLFNEILNQALDDKEMADDPNDPKIRISWLKIELNHYLKEKGKEV